MSPTRARRDAPTRRRRPPATHERRPDAEPSRTEDAPEEPPEDEPAEDEGGEVPPEDESEAAPPEDQESEDEEPEDEEPEDEDEESPEDEEPPEDEAPRGGLDAHEAAKRAVEHLTALTHHTPEGVVGVERDDGGWTVTVEALEDAHVPSTSDVLAEYEVRLDADGGLVSATRCRRYVRGRTEF